MAGRHLQAVGKGQGVQQPAAGDKHLPTLGMGADFGTGRDLPGFEHWKWGTSGYTIWKDLMDEWHTDN